MNFLFDHETKGILDILLINLSPGEKIYMVGGMVRDILMSQPIHDFDFAFEGDVRKYAIKVADTLGAAFFMLNDQFKTARIINREMDSHWKNIDIIQMRGSSIEEDLSMRDITINALAIDVELQNQLIDPLSGAEHLNKKMLVACSNQSFFDDPIRILRAVRQSVSYHWKIESQTLKQMKDARFRISKISQERKRDEFMRILDLKDPSPAINLLDHLEVLELLFPEIKLMKLKRIGQQEFSNTYWERTKLTLKKALMLEKALVNDYQPDSASELRIGQAVLKLGRFRNQLTEYFGIRIHAERSLRSLLFLIIILYKNGDLLDTETVNVPYLTKHVYNFENHGKTLVLTKNEIKFASKIVEKQKIIHDLAKEKGDLTGGEVFSFFRETGSAGILLCFLTLAETLANNEDVFSENRFNNELQICRTLMTGFFQKYSEWVDPPQFVNGNDLKNIVKSEDTILIGSLLEKVRFAIAEGMIKNKKEAINFVKSYYLPSIEGK